MHLTEWSAAIRERFGKLPDDYISLDTETLSFGEDNLPVEIGHALVKGRKPISRYDYLLDWLKEPAQTEDGFDAVQADWLQDQLLYVRDRMEKDEHGNPTGRKYDITFQKLRDAGRTWHKVLRYYLDLLRRVTAKGFCIVGHNVSFDLKLLSSVWDEFLGESFDFDAVPQFDTGVLFKAMQIGLTPAPHESLAEYTHRVRHKRCPGVPWNLLHGMRTLGVIDKHGLDASKLHGAGYDSYCTHLFFEELRLTMEGSAA